MQWVGLSTVFFTAMVKFMFSPALGPALKLSYMETYIANSIGALVSMTIFYFAAEFFLKRSHQKKVQKYQEAIASGISVLPNKIFTKRNKTIVRLKNKIGIVPFSLWAPFLLSIPLGSIITAKFFGKRKMTFPLMIIGIFLNNTITVSLVYFLKDGTSSVL
jgi:hypothetical protein